MTERTPEPANYEERFESLLHAGEDPIGAAVRLADDYLDGKPRIRGKQKLTRTDRDQAFWSCKFLSSIPVEAWQKESLVLALARYLSQDRVAQPKLLQHIASNAPESVKRAVRYSGLVLRGDSPRHREVVHLGEVAPSEFGDFIGVLLLFDEAYRGRVALVEEFRQPLAELSPLDLLIYSSLHAFEDLVPRQAGAAPPDNEPDQQPQPVWEAINDLLTWKLHTASKSDLQISERDIAEAMRVHLFPFLLASGEGFAPREDIHFAFKALLAAQIELNSFISRAADAFSFDDSIEYSVCNGQLLLRKLDQDAGDKWQSDGHKLTKLHSYWFNRGLVSCHESGLLTQVVGTPENSEANRIALIKATATKLRLTEAYGVSDTVETASGSRFNLLQALISLELMNAFFLKEFISPYIDHLRKTGDFRLALSMLAFDGNSEAIMQNRFPITWSEREQKLRNIRAWTVTEDQPAGSARAADAIVEFWSSDWAELCDRLRNGKSGLAPELSELPFLKMGRYLFQLPWLVAFQNTQTTAINNLRRLGARRNQARKETRRIEDRLASLFETRGFTVVRNYTPDRTENENAGEIDLVCAGDGQVFVLEIKSTFLRSSMKAAWIHRKNTLRKAGLQLKRKVAGVEQALVTGGSLLRELGLSCIEEKHPVRGWIVDTSIEHDHERFSGYLKVSLEEVIIALRDDHHLLHAGSERATESSKDSGHSLETAADAGARTLYPGGFSVERFIEVIESEAVWEDGH